jgi:adenosylhomocysteine nucleosidase
MRPGIVAAMAAEARTLAKGPIAAGEWIHLPEDAMLLLSGIGASRARSAAQTLLENGATALVSWGFAGALDPGLSPGSLILPESILAKDQSPYCVDPVWRESLCNRLKPYIDLHGGALAESPVVLASCAEKIALFQRTGARAVDMESASIALIAKEAGVPFLVVRAISDAAKVAIPRSVLNSIDKFGRVRFSRLLPCLARRPLELLALVRLGRNSRVAQATLARVALHARSNLLCPPHPSGMIGATRDSMTVPAITKGDHS